MRAIKRADTKPERALRSQLHAAGLRYRKDFGLSVDGGRVRPDIVFTRRQVAVFVDGCFWHGCAEHGRTPKVNTSYWGAKLARTQQRDRAADEMLAAAGWLVVRVWEHTPVEDATELVQAALRAAADE